MPYPADFSPSLTDAPEADIGIRLAVVDSRYSSMPIYPKYLEAIDWNGVDKRSRTTHLLTESLSLKAIRAHNLNAIT
jgi:hypothetical protein